MKLNVNRFLTEPGAQIEFSYTAENLGNEDGLVFSRPVSVQGKASNTGLYYELAAIVKTEIVLVCDRCLQEIHYPVELEFTERYVPLNAAEGGLGEVEDASFQELEGEWIDVDRAVRDNLILHLPMRILCSDDCPGLCPICGKYRQDGKCECKFEDVDPRLAVLANLKLKNQ